MANRNFEQFCYHYEKKFVMWKGSFAPNGTGAVSQASIKGKGVATIARTGVGTFLITFSDSFRDMFAGTATLQLNAVAGQMVQLGAFSQSAKTLVVRVVDTAAGTAADVAANANNRIHLDIVFKNTSV